MTFEQWFYTLPLRLRSLFGNTQVDQELKDELRDHLEQEIEANLARGCRLARYTYRSIPRFAGLILAFG